MYWPLAVCVSVTVAPPPCFVATTLALVSGEKTSAAGDGASTWLRRFTVSAGSSFSANAVATNDVPAVDVRDSVAGVVPPFFDAAIVYAPGATDASEYVPVVPVSGTFNAGPPAVNVAVTVAPASGADPPTSGSPVTVTVSVG